MSARLFGTASVWAGFLAWEDDLYPGPMNVMNNTAVGCRNTKKYFFAEFANSLTSSQDCYVHRGEAE